MLHILVPTTKYRHKELDRLISSLRKNDYPYVLCIYEGWDGGACKAVSKMVEGINGLVLLLNDDLIVDKDYLKTLCDAYDKSFQDQEGVAQGFIHRKKNLIMFPLCHTKIFKKYWPSCYNHYFADKEFTHVVNIKKIPYLYVPEAKQDQPQCHSNNFVPDENYAQVIKHRRHDKNMYAKRKKENFFQ